RRTSTSQARQGRLVISASMLPSVEGCSVPRTPTSWSSPTRRSRHRGGKAGLAPLGCFETRAPTARRRRDPPAPPATWAWCDRFRTGSRPRDRWGEVHRDDLVTLPAARAREDVA